MTDRTYLSLYSCSGCGAAVVVEAVQNTREVLSRKTNCDCPQKLQDKVWNRHPFVSFFVGTGAVLKGVAKRYWCKATGHSSEAFELKDPETGEVVISCGRCSRCGLMLSKNQA